MNTGKRCPLAWLLLLPLLATPAGGARPQPRVEIVPPRMPADFHPPQRYKVLFQARAEGVQIYECKAKPGNAGQFEWTFLAPRADLFDDHGDKIGKHYAGPTWEANDGSKVKAVKQAAYDAPVAHAIPWLLLKATDHQGKGMFRNVRYIQRVDTWAGSPPTQPANRAREGKKVEVKYQATYLFYGRAP